MTVKTTDFDIFISLFLYNATKYKRYYRTAFHLIDMWYFRIAHYYSTVFACNIFAIN